VAAVGGLNKVKLVVVAMVTKVQKIFNGNGSHFEKINNIQHNFTWHMIFLQGFIKFDQDFSEK
jgi:hypothetical protein